MPVLVHHQQSQPVAGIEQLWRGRVVRRAVGVAAHVLEAAHAKLLHGIRHGHADAGVILVVAGAEQLQRAAVEEEALVGVEAERANAKRRVAGVYDLVAHADLSVQRVQRGAVHVPELRARELHVLLRLEVHPLREPELEQPAGGFLPARVEHGAMDLTDRLLVGLIDDSRADRDVRPAGTRLVVEGRSDERAPVPDVQRRGLRQPHVAVDARALVPPALDVGGVDAHRQHVLATVVRHIADVEVEARVAAAVVADAMPVQPHFAAAEDAVELEPQLAAEVFGGEIEPLAVPGNAARAKAMADVPGRVIGLLDEPVVREVQRAPRAVIEAHASRALGPAGLH